MCYRNLTQSDLRKYVDIQYRPSRMVLSAVGNIEHSKIANLAERYFGSLSTGQSGNVSDSKGIRFTGSEVTSSFSAFLILDSEVVLHHSRGLFTTYRWTTFSALIFNFYLISYI